MWAFGRLQSFSIESGGVLVFCFDVLFVIISSGKVATQFYGACGVSSKDNCAVLWVITYWGLCC